MKLYYIADGKAYVWEDGKETALPSAVLESYLNKIRESAKRNEWKQTGSGAQFMGQAVGGADVESRLQAVCAQIKCLGADPQEPALFYSIEIDGMAGIYRRYADCASGEGIVLSSCETAYRDFDVDGKQARLVVSAACAGESHIALCKIGEGRAQVLTDGASWDSQPVFSKTDPAQIYFVSAGLEIQNANAETAATREPSSLPERIIRLQNAAEARKVGPAALCLLDTAAGEITELYADAAYDYLHPQSTANGDLYYVRRPYSMKRAGGASTPLGCLGDILLLPFRLLGALFGFFNFFTMKYSGKTLSKSAGVKTKDEGQLFIDGNFIEAEKELSANKNKGEKNPGIIPRSWELHRRKPDGTDELVRRGVVAYRVLADGSVVFSNGSALLCRKPDGTEEKLCGIDRVTFIME